MAKLRLSLTISGAVALGAYEGGALAALLVAVRELASGVEPELMLDAIGGASAGSITALLAARALLQGHDPVQVMRQAWVEEDSLAKLRGHWHDDAPLAMGQLEQMAHSLLDPPGTPNPLRQATPVQLSFALACLRGLEYDLPALDARQQVRAVTYLDFVTNELRADAPVADALVDEALASAANALGFPPRLLDRGANRAEYEKAHVVNLDGLDPLTLWYTDGGTLDDEPLGRTLDIVAVADERYPTPDGDWHRLHLLIHPHPTSAPTGAAWAAADNPPTWLQTGLRALSIQRTQSLYSDLKQVEKTNTRVAWAQLLDDGLGPVLDALPAPQADAVSTALRDVLARIEGQAEELAAGSAQAGFAAPRPDPQAAARPSELLSRAVRRAAAVAEKHRAQVEVISPLVLPETQPDHQPAPIPVERMLAGELLFHFGGFLDHDMRVSDFDLGFRSTQVWLEAGGLRRHGVEPASAQRALDAVTAAYTPGDTWRVQGPRTLVSLLAEHKWQTMQLAGQVGHVVLRDLRDPHPQ